MTIGLSNSFEMYVGLSRYISLSISFQLVLKYISVNLQTSIGLSISFKMYKR